MARPYIDPTNGKWVGEHETRVDGEVSRQTEWFDTEEDARRFARTGDRRRVIRATIEITGETENDVEIAVEAVLDSIRRGNTSGFDRNDTGSYTFSMEDL